MEWLVPSTRYRKFYQSKTRATIVNYPPTYTNTTNSSPHHIWQTSCCPYSTICGSWKALGIMFKSSLVPSLGEAEPLQVKRKPLQHPTFSSFNYEIYESETLMSCRRSILGQIAELNQLVDPRMCLSGVRFLLLSLERHF